jgi:hypothetical protein
MSKNVTEELGRMFYLLEHQRGVVVSEQESPNKHSRMILEAVSTINYPNGDTYTGELIVRGGKQMKNGQGTLVYDGGNAKYVGNFKDDKFDGQGTLTFPNQPGVEYTGNFINNQLDGQGTLKNSDGTSYVGNFKNYTPNGNGIKYNADGSILEQGNFVNGDYQPNSNTTTPAGGTATTATSTPQEYVVQKGDTLSKIGQKLGVQWKEIATLNQIKNVNLIRVGQKLKIPGKTQTTATQTDLVSAASNNTSSLLNYLFEKMPSFKTFGKYIDRGGVYKGIGTNLTEGEIKQKYPTELIGMPIAGFKFYQSNENDGPFTKETVDSVYLNYVHDTKTNPMVYNEPTTATTETISGVTQELVVARKTKKADRRICRIINKDIKNNTQMSSVLGDVCQVLELCKTGGFIDKSVTLEACNKVETPSDEQGTTQETPLNGGKTVEPIDVS